MNKYKDPEYMKKYRLKNKKQLLAYNKKYKKEHPTAWFEWNLLRSYGLTVQQYNEYLLKQKGVCAICGKQETRINPRTHKPYALSTDHDHKTGKVRGLLCYKCNTGLGWIEGNYIRPIQIIRYLKRR